MMNFNEDVWDNEIKECIDELKLKDSMIEKMGEENSPRTYDRGSASIDTIIRS